MSGKEEVAAVERVDPFHHRPHLLSRQLLHRCIKLVFGIDKRRGVVGGFQEPVLEHQACRRHQIQAVVDGEALIATVQEGVDHAGVEVQIRGDRDVALQRMVGPQSGDGRLDHLQGLLVLLEAHFAEDRLHQLHPGTAVACVEHDRRHSVGAQHVRQGLHPGLRIVHVVQHAGRHHQVEALVEAGNLLDRKQVQFKVFERVLLLEVLLVVKRGLTDIDRHHLRRPVHVGDLCRLVGAAASDQDVDIGPVRPVRPEHAVGVAGVEPLPVVGQKCLEIMDRLRVGPLLVLLGHHIRTRVIAHGGHYAVAGGTTENRLPVLPAGR